MTFIVSYGGKNIFTLHVDWRGTFPDTIDHVRAIVGPHAHVTPV